MYGFPHPPESQRLDIHQHTTVSMAQARPCLPGVQNALW